LNNLDVRKTIRDNRLRNWEVAEKIGINDATFSRWLRIPLNDDRKQRVICAIKELTKEIHA